MKTTTSRATRAVLNKRAIVAQWRVVASHPIHPPLNPPLIQIFKKKFGDGLIDLINILDFIRKIFQKYFI